MTEQNEVVIESTPAAKRIAVILTLIIAGEAIFLLPFVVARIFRPTFLDVYGLTNLELGIAFSVYGFIAMFSYFLGGPLADRYSSRKLMTFAMIATSVGGILFGVTRSFTTLMILYGFWGLTTILLFWAALIRATREWGGVSSQGRAYGYLDGGRGLMAALLASISVFLFACFLPSDVASASMDERSAALSNIIWLFTALGFLVAMVIWWVIPESNSVAQNEPASGRFDGIRDMMRRPSIWLHAVIVVCAYVGYKGTDDFSLYARDAMGYDDVRAAHLATISFWTRPFAAVLAGIIADRLRTSTVVIGSFILLIVGCLVIASGMMAPNQYFLIILVFSATSAGIYALRGVYFALFQESKTPLAATGAAIGIVSFIGYTPDIFMGPVMGYLIDEYPGATGHQYVFFLIASFGLIGLISTVLFRFKTDLRVEI